MGDARAGPEGSCELHMWERAVSLLLGYLFGSIMTADIVTKHYTGKTAHEIGSGNPGMTNVFRNVGWKQGLMVLAGDILKAVVPIALSYLLFYESVGKICVQYAGLGTVLGHDFSFMAHGHGGNGVTVSSVWLILGLGGWGFLAGMVAGSLVFFTGLMPLAAVALGIVSVITAIFVADTETVILFSISCVIIIVRHRKGIMRMVRGEQEHTLKLTEMWTKHKAKKAAAEAATEAGEDADEAAAAAAAAVDEQRPKRKTQQPMH